MRALQGLVCVLTPAVEMRGYSHDSTRVQLSRFQQRWVSLGTRFRLEESRTIALHFFRGSTYRTGAGQFTGIAVSPAHVRKSNLKCHREV
jgi:hypothetical protein